MVGLYVGIVIIFSAGDAIFYSCVFNLCGGLAIGFRMEFQFMLSIVSRKPFTSSRSRASDAAVHRQGPSHSFRPAVLPRSQSISLTGSAVFFSLPSLILPQLLFPFHP